MQVTIANTQINVIEHQGRRVVTLAMIDQVHQRPDGTARRNFNENKPRLVAGEDYLELNQPDEIRTLGITRPQGGTPSSLIIITESGYLMLVKSFTDDLAWQVQRQLVDSYFRVNAKSAPMSLAQMCLVQAQALVDMEQRQSSVEQQVKVLEAKIPHQQNYFTILGYCRFTGVDVTNNQANALGRRASKLSRERNLDIGFANDPRYGRVNTYHEDVLDDVFTQHFEQAA